jgi:L-asparaginase/Glu-tRNA(Gln) amidotransferase subunit D
MAVGAPTRLGCLAQLFWWMPQFSQASSNVQIAGMAAIYWAIWKTRNNSCFERKTLKNPNNLIFLDVAFLKYWAGLHSNPDSTQLQQGANALLNLALGAGTRGSAADTGVRRLTNQADGDMEVDEEEDADDMDV